jgi:hypothetical protein
MGQALWTQFCVVVQEKNIVDWLVPVERVLYRYVVASSKAQILVVVDRHQFVFRLAKIQHRFLLFFAPWLGLLARILYKAMGVAQVLARPVLDSGP